MEKNTKEKEVKGRKKLRYKEHMCYMPGFLISEKLSNLPKVTRLSIWEKAERKSKCLGELWKHR